MTDPEGSASERRLISDRRLVLWIALVMWAVAGVISMAMLIQVSADWIQSVDDHVYSFVVDNEVGALVSVARFLGQIGSVVVMAPVMIGIAVLLGVQRRWSAVTIWVTAIAVSQFVSIAMKNLYTRARPPLPLVETTSFSFPSGHAITGAVFAIGLIVLLVPPARRLPIHWAIAALYIVAMAWSRVYSRAHWLSDVTAGIAIGTAIFLAVTLLVVRDDDRQQFTEGVDG